VSGITNTHTQTVATVGHEPLAHNPSSPDVGSSW
jgi:hypothetical protein